MIRKHVRYSTQYRAAVNVCRCLRFRVSRVSIGLGLGLVLGFTFLCQSRAGVIIGKTDSVTPSGSSQADTGRLKIRTTETKPNPNSNTDPNLNPNPTYPTNPTEP